MMKLIYKGVKDDRTEMKCEARSCFSSQYMWDELLNCIALCMLLCIVLCTVLTEKDLQFFS